MLIAGVAFIGGRANGGEVHRRLRDTVKRYALEMEGVNAYAITHFSDWDALSAQIRAGFDFGKQRCTAYTRWVGRIELIRSTRRRPDRAPPRPRCRCGAPGRRCAGWPRAPC
ncbi:aldehyde dehydrogenase family protein [Corallococcus interemptor]|uniref:aldehyde dehydrogenase family protein n=1 Tax=Corallococcus interemptor TaxID=2316720 RepID=UPI001FC9C7A4|nr:aldehyde dehydrogenase family protein [Corallococcus interemptor]